jgi:hypothetical protein
MNIASLRTTLKSKWLTYYRDNRNWITRLRVWGTYEERRRPSSSFILGALSAQAPELMELLPLVVDLNNNPDRIVAALGLDFNPEDELEAFEQSNQAATSTSKQALNMLPSQASNQNQQPINLVRQPATQPFSEPLVQPVSQPAKKMSQILNPPTSQLVSQPTERSTVQPSTVQPANPFIGQPSGSGRIPLDTAQLSVNEQPDRDTNNSVQTPTQNDRSRDAEPLP